MPLTHQCSCPGFQLTYKCTVTGDGGATIWRGTVFQCPSTDNTITLRHSAFTQIRGCNRGTIIGYGVNSQNSCYTSQINITTSSTMNNKTVECVYNNGSTISVIGTSVITIISGIEHINNIIVIIRCILVDSALSVIIFYNIHYYRSVTTSK